MSCGLLAELIIWCFTGYCIRCSFIYFL